MKVTSAWRSHAQRNAREVSSQSSLVPLFKEVQRLTLEAQAEFAKAGFRWLRENLGGTATATVAEFVSAEVKEKLKRAEESRRRKGRSPHTVRTYESDLRIFEKWCATRGLQSLPASSETILSYLYDRAKDFKLATLKHYLSAINKAHLSANLPSPVRGNAAIKEAVKTIEAAMGSRAIQKAPLLDEDFKSLVKSMSDDLKGVRDRALLLVGFAGAFRRSELVALDVADVTFTPEGLLLTLRRSKTDQEGAGRQVAIPFGSHAQTCPVRALRAWLDAAAITEGPVFRWVHGRRSVSSVRLTGQSIALVVKKYAAAAGLDAEKFSGESLRPGGKVAIRRRSVAA